MAELKHTPGPWRLVNRGLPSARIEGADGQGVCTWARYPMDSCSNGDAALVAAAPVLAERLDALEKLVQVLLRPGAYGATLPDICRAVEEEAKRARERLAQIQKEASRG